MNTSPVNAVICANRDEFDKAGPGAIFLWRFAEKIFEGGDVGHAMIKCPGCGREGGQHLRKPGTPHPPDRASWEISGLPDKPTLKPSVNCEGCCGWHGYLTDGVWHI